MGRKARDKKTRPSVTAAAPEPGETAAEHRTPVIAPVPPRRRREPFLPPRAWIWAIAIFAAAAAAYAGGLDTPFLLDDPINITKSTQILRPLSLFSLLRDPRAFVTASLRWNYLVGGFAVGGYHVLNTVAHAATAFLVFALSWTTLRLPVFENRYKDSAEALAGVTALVFLLHPMQTESVTYVIQRAEIFVSAGLLGTLLAMLHMRDGVTREGLALMAASCVLGLYSKPSFAVVPALLIVQNLCFLSRGGSASMKKLGPVFAVAAVAGIATFALTKMTGGLGSATAGFDIEGITSRDYLSAQFGVIVQYLRVALWPSDLCFDCGYRGAWPVHATFLGDSVAIPLAILAALVAASLAAWKQQPLVTFAVFASAVVLAPTSSFLPLADFYVEHRMYLPIAFLAMALVPMIHDAIGAAASRFSASPGTATIVGRVLAGVVLVVLAVATMARNELLSDPIALMEDALAQAPKNERVHYNLANAYKRVGRTADAIPHYEEAIRLLPNVVRSYENLGSLYLDQNKLDDALKVFLAGAAAKPDAGMAHRNVSSTYLRLGRPEEALAAAKKSLEVEKGNANGYRLEGDALAALGRRAEAIEAWKAGLAANPSDGLLKERLSKQGSR